MKEFRRLVVWEKAHALTLVVYKTTAAFPKEEMYGITSQMRRCGASVAANIAEGCGRTGNGEFYQFLNIAAGSLFELEYFLLLSHDLGFTSAATYENLKQSASEVERMLAALLRKVDSSRQLRTNAPARAGQRRVPIANC